MSAATIDEWDVCRNTGPARRLRCTCGRDDVPVVVLAEEIFYEQPYLVLCRECALSIAAALVNVTPEVKP